MSVPSTKRMLTLPDDDGRHRGQAFDAVDGAEAVFERSDDQPFGLGRRGRRVGGVDRDMRGREGRAGTPAASRSSDSQPRTSTPSTAMAIVTRRSTAKRMIGLTFIVGARPPVNDPTIECERFDLHRNFPLGRVTDSHLISGSIRLRMSPPPPPSATATHATHTTHTAAHSSDSTAAHPTRRATAHAAAGLASLTTRAAHLLPHGRLQASPSRPASCRRSGHRSPADVSLRGSRRQSCRRYRRWESSARSRRHPR